MNHSRFCATVSESLNLIGLLWKRRLSLLWLQWNAFIGHLQPQMDLIYIRTWLNPHLEKCYDEQSGYQHVTIDVSILSRTSTFRMISSFAWSCHTLSEVFLLYQDYIRLHMRLSFGLPILILPIEKIMPFIVDHHVSYSRMDYRRCNKMALFAFQQWGRYTYTCMCRWSHQFWRPSC